jgi:hypothetical protein
MLIYEKFDYFMSLYHLLIYNMSGNIFWPVDPLLGNDRKISSYTTAVIRYDPVNNGHSYVMTATDS